MTTKQRNRVLTFAEAITQNQKTARVWVELRYNIPICAYFLVRTNKTCRVIPYNLGIGSFVVGEEAYGRKVAMLGERADTRRNQTRAVE